MYDFLAGLRVIDLTTIVLGPYATQILGDFGADVIKVEPPAGDVLRHVEPARHPGMGAPYLNSNRNKRAIAIDLKSDGGRAAMLRLLAGADVFVHNLRPGPAARLGLTYEALKQVNPRLIYCVTVGFGEGGPYADRPAYDDVIQAMGGLAQLNADGAGNPRFLPTVACDKIGALMAAQVMLAAVARQQRTGEGCYIGAPMFEGLVSYLMVEHLAGNTFRPAMGTMGYDRLLTPYRRPFETADGHLAVLPYTTEQWTRFLTAAGRPEVAGEERVRNPAERSRHIGELYAILAEAMRTRTTADWIATLTELDIPHAPVQSLDDVFHDPHLAAVGMFEELEHPTEGPVVSVRAPYEVRDADQAPDRLAPRLGEHTRQVLAEAGLDPAEIDALVDSGAVRQA
ncbi:MAG: CoA transferase [Hyphomicrobiales bacterium]|nr:CoA transferase [Hyphomicrobiales bacterium]